MNEHLLHSSAFQAKEAAPAADRSEPRTTRGSKKAPRRSRAVE
jgi:hypothetical protein